MVYSGQVESSVSWKKKHWETPSPLAHFVILPLKRRWALCGMWNAWRGVFYVQVFSILVQTEQRSFVFVVGYSLENLMEFDDHALKPND